MREQRLKRKKTLQQEQDQAYDQACHIVDNLILQKEYDALGINVSEAEFNIS